MSDGVDRDTAFRAVMGLLEARAADHALLDAFEALVSRFPGDAEIRHMYSRVLRGVGQAGPAFEESVRALELAPGDCVLALSVARTWAELGRLELAADLIAEVDAAIERDQVSLLSMWWSVDAVIREGRGDLRGAIASLEKAVALDPRDDLSRQEIVRLRAL